MSSNDDLAILEAMLAMRQAERKSATDKVKERLGEDLTVIYNGKPAYDLNARLVLNQGLDASELRALKALHAEKLKYFDLMNETDDAVALRKYAKEVEFIEFEMQKNWHFPQDSRFHEWYKVPKCSCPKLDNKDRQGTEYRIIDPKCVIHGDGLAF